VFKLLIVLISLLRLIILTFLLIFLLIRKDSGQLAKKKIDANSGGKGASSSSGQGASKDVGVRPGTILLLVSRELLYLYLL
jgi:hypothetical protein